MLEQAPRSVLLTDLYPRIVKPRAALRVPPNLADYAATTRDFTWAAARARLDGLPGGARPEHRARGSGSPRRRPARRPPGIALARPHRARGAC